ncbi:MAG: sigma-70 family RNA polymerase sigma factor [Ruminococcaceae bacterium]|nr:sigma-70 family RNA polymerase sigma factor [Oscillospiraceae bacterium]
MEDRNIIELFTERSERAIVELSEKYGNVCMKVAYNVLGNKEDSEECVNDAYLGVWNAIPPQKPNPLLTFVLRIVKNLSLKRLKYNSAKKRGADVPACFEELSEVLTDMNLENSPEARLDIEMTAKVIDEFLETLSYTNRYLFVRRYWYMDSYESLSGETGLKEAAIRKRVSRMWTDLKLRLKSLEEGLSYA